MKKVYEAQNSLEAHMILNMLEQAGLNARIDGEYLQGGIGELPAIGVVRVMVDERDYADARAIVEEWDAAQQAEAPRQAPARSKSPGILLGIGCLALGVAATSWYYRTPVTEDGIDYDGDGSVDEKWTYVNHRASETAQDRNLDGRVDMIYEFDRRGIVESAVADEDFDGDFETRILFENGHPRWQESDTDGDGITDYTVAYRHGKTDTVTFLGASTGKPVKVQKFGPFTLERSRFDSNRDGVLERVREFDALEEVREDGK